MKKITGIVFLSILLIACKQQDSKQTASTDSHGHNTTAADATATTTVEWLDSTYQHFGKISKGQVLEISFRLKNTGDKPLIISNTSAGCGCTVTETPKEPIPPGQEQTIRAKYDSKNQGAGRQTKTITVQANTTPTPVHTLTFSVDVE